MRYQHTETGEIKTHQQWQNELGMSFHADRLPEFLIVPQYATPEPTLEQRRERQRQMLKMGRIERVSAPINNVQVGRTEDREDITGTLANWHRLGLTDTINWIMADNTVQALTQADLHAVVDAYALRKMQVFSEYQALLKKLETAEDVTSVDWPS